MNPTLRASLRDVVWKRPACLGERGQFIKWVGLVSGAIRPAGLPGVRHLHFRIGVDALMR